MNGIARLSTLASFACAVFFWIATPVVHAQEPATGTASDQRIEALERRVEAFERATKAEIDALRRELDARTAELAAERAKREEAERRVADTAAAAGAAAPVAPDAQATSTIPATQDDGKPVLQSGSEQRHDRPDPLSALPMKGGDLIGNVYTGDNFKVRIGGSLRTSFQHNSTPVGDAVSQALLPDPNIPGGGDNAGRDSFRALAGHSRMLLAVQGPTTLGGKTFGYLEFDFARNLSGGDNGAINPNPRLRHAYLRWIFDGIGKEGSQLLLTVGQTGGYADLIPETVDFNVMSGGLGVVFRRNPRATVAYLIPVGSSGRIGIIGGVERPFLGNDNVGGDLGNGEAGEIPVFSLGVGYESTSRIGDSFGIRKLRFGARFATGRFIERFEAGTFNADFGLQSNFDEQSFTAKAVHGGISIDDLGFNAESRARTFTFRMGGLWTNGEARYLDAGFDRRVVHRADGTLEPARSAGGFVNPMFFLTDTVSIRWAGGAQYALDPSLPVVTGSLTNNYFRTRNWNSEISAWWTPGPFTFAIAYNFIKTNFRTVDFMTGASTDLVNSNTKFEAICWFSF
ncbi:MAG: hypothetical protein IPF82_12630 [Blastocatellia bacterium]|nr:hypothetical protein [Blastocatellia bacterium]